MDRGTHTPHKLHTVPFASQASLEQGWPWRASLGQRPWSGHRFETNEGVELSGRAEKGMNLTPAWVFALGTNLSQGLKVSLASVSSHVNEQFYQRHIQL